MNGAPLRFDVPDLGIAARWLESQPAYAALSLVRQAGDTVLSVYLDTPDWRVYHAGYLLRVSDTTEGDPDRAEQATTTVLEPREPGTRASATLRTTASPGGIETVIGDAATGGPAADRLRLLLRRAVPQPLFTASVRRRHWIVSAGTDELAAITLSDHTITVPGRPPAALRRAEVRVLAADGLERAGLALDAWRMACGLTPVTQSDLEAGLVAAELRPGLVDLGPTDVTIGDRAVDRAYAVLRRRLAELLSLEGGTALGDDPEQLHQMRVATRRLRAVLRMFDSLLPPELIAARAEWQWLAQALGAVRDLDVQIEHLDQLRQRGSWDDATALMPLRTQFERQRTEARRELLSTLESERYGLLVASFSDLLRASPSATAPDMNSRDLAAATIPRRYRQFRRDAERLSAASPEAEYHALRIRAKRLRYSLELFQDLYGRRGAQALLALKALQDGLGELQDLTMTDQRLRGLVVTHAGELPPETLVMIGRLYEQHRARSRELIDTFPATLAPVRRSFRRLGSPAVRPDPLSEPADEPSAVPVEVPTESHDHVPEVPQDTDPAEHPLRAFLRRFSARRQSDSVDAREDTQQP